MASSPTPLYIYFKALFILGLVAHCVGLILAVGRQKQTDLREFEAGLVYTVNFKSAKATE